MPTKDRVQQLIDYVHDGRIQEALDEFYADDVAMQENLAPPVVGRAANQQREEAFFSSITLHKNRAQAVLVDGDHAVIRWDLDFTGGDGKRYRIDQLAYQTWRGDRIVSERFVYDSAAIAA